MLGSVASVAARRVLLFLKFLERVWLRFLVLMQWTAWHWLHFYVFFYFVYGFF